MVRIKNRYLLLNILYPSSSTGQATSTTTAGIISFQGPTPDYIDAGRLVGHLKTHISLLFGDYGLGSSLSSLKVVYLSTATSTAILRVPRNHHQLVWAALTHITELPSSRRGGAGPPCVIRVVRVSGTIRKAEEELIRRAKRSLVRAKIANGDGQHVSWLSGGPGTAAVAAASDVSLHAAGDSIHDDDNDDEGEDSN